MNGITESIEVKLFSTKQKEFPTLFSSFRCFCFYVIKIFREVSAHKHEHLCEYLTTAYYVQKASTPRAPADERRMLHYVDIFLRIKDRPIQVNKGVFNSTCTTHYADVSHSVSL